MARTFPFQAYRYTPAAGPLHDLVTLPDDNSSPNFSKCCVSKNQYSILRLDSARGGLNGGPADASGNPSALLNQWLTSGVVGLDTHPSFYPYFQEFRDPETGEKLLRKGVTGLGSVDDYSRGTVYGHEQTIADPTGGRLELLRQTRAHFGPLLMLYSDPKHEVDRFLSGITSKEPLVSVRDDDGVLHTLWQVSRQNHILHLQYLLRDKSLVIADGHHRYNAALAFRKTNTHLRGADKIMMTFVNMYSPALRILATHRLVTGCTYVQKIVAGCKRISVETLLGLLHSRQEENIRIGILVKGREDGYLFERQRDGCKPDVEVLHAELLKKCCLGGCGVAEDDDINISYVRGLDAAIKSVRSEVSQLAFLLQPPTIEQVARTALKRELLPHKSTDFYPKLLTGLTIFRLG